MNLSNLFNETLALPADERAHLVSLLLQTLNVADEANTAAWLGVAKQRLNDLDLGRVKAVAGDEVFERTLGSAQAQAFTLTDARVHGEAMLMAEPNAWQQLEEEHLIVALSKFNGRRT